MPSAEEREIVRTRAGRRCEYCQAPEEITGYTFHVEHIVAAANGGPNSLDNYALSCAHCNFAKSDHRTGWDPVTRTEIRLFNPRQDDWRQHFKVRKGMQIKGRTEIGRATEQRLKLNSPDQLEARRLWAQLNYYPASAGEWKKSAS